MSEKSTQGVDSPRCEVKCSFIDWQEKARSKPSVLQICSLFYHCLEFHLWVFLPVSKKWSGRFGAGCPSLSAPSPFGSSGSIAWQTGAFSEHRCPLLYAFALCAETSYCFSITHSLTHPPLSTFTSVDNPLTTSKRKLADSLKTLWKRGRTVHNCVSMLLVETLIESWADKQHWKHLSYTAVASTGFYPCLLLLNGT